VGKKTFWAMKNLIFRSNKFFSSMIISCLFLCSSHVVTPAQADISGLWEFDMTVSIMGEQETGSSFTVFYQDGDVLYEPTMTLHKVSSNTFAISDPVDHCELGICVTLESFSATFPSNSSYTGTGSGTAEVDGDDYPFSLSHQGHKMTPQVLSSDISVSGLSGAEDSYKAFSIEVPSNAEEIEVTTEGGWGDCDLSLMYERPPFDDDYSCDDYNDEYVSVSDPSPGTWYVVLYGFESYGDMTLTASVSTHGNQFMPVPPGQQTWTYAPLLLPIKSVLPSQAKPIGVGSIAEGGDTLSIKVALSEFSGLVDVYFAISAPSVYPDTIFILASDGSLQPLSMGFEPWKENTKVEIDETLFGNIPISWLPSGTYYLYLAVTPASRLDAYYLWTTYFIIPFP